MKQQESSFHFISSFQRIPKFGVPTNSAQIFQNELFFQTSRHLPLGSPLYAGTVHESQVFFSHSDLDRSVDVLPFCQVSSLGRALCGLWLPRHRGEEGRRMQLKRRFAEIVSLHFSAQAQVKCIYIYTHIISCSIIYIYIILFVCSTMLYICHTILHNILLNNI